jgi:urease accessory protein UreF
MVSPTVDPLAAQMAQLLVASDLDELREIVKRWLAEAPTERSRRQYEQFGARLVELKQALAEQPMQPTREELETALTMMLRLAAHAEPGAGGRPAP